MDRRSRRLAALSLSVAACGGSDNDGGNEGVRHRIDPARRKRSGAASSRSCGPATSITSTAARPTTRWATSSATRRRSTLYNYKADDGAKMVPDLADGDPQVSEDGKTVTVKIKPGVKYSPPYNKEVTSADVKYAIERGFFTSVASGFTPSYFGDLVGAKVGVERRHQDRGHHDARRPDARPQVQARGRRRDGLRRAGLRRDRPGAEGVRGQVRRETPSTYGENQLATGPYMIENDAVGQGDRL